MTAKTLIDLLIADQRQAPHARHLVDDLGSQYLTHNRLPPHEPIEEVAHERPA